MKYKYFAYCEKNDDNYYEGFLLDFDFSSTIVEAESMDLLRKSLTRQLKNIINKRMEERKNYYNENCDINKHSWKYDISNIIEIEIELPDRLFLDDEDFGSYMEIQFQIEACSKTLQELIILRAKREQLYHDLWTQLRRKYKLDITKNYMTSRLNGEITEITKTDSNESVRANLDLQMPDNEKS